MNRTFYCWAERLSLTCSRRRNCTSSGNKKIDRWLGLLPGTRYARDSKACRALGSEISHNRISWANPCSVSKRISTCRISLSSALRNLRRSLSFVVSGLIEVSRERSLGRRWWRQVRHVRRFFSFQPPAFQLRKPRISRIPCQSDFENLLSNNRIVRNGVRVTFDAPFRRRRTGCFAQVSSSPVSFSPPVHRPA